LFNFGQGKIDHVKAPVLPVPPRKNAGDISHRIQIAIVQDDKLSVLSHHQILLDDEDGAPGRRYLRQRGLDTALREGDICYSACPYLLAAGTSRDVPEDASVGVHQHFFGESTLLPAFVAVEDIQRGQGEVMTYLDQMGIDPLVMQHALVTPPDEIYLLLPEELTRYRFVENTEPS